jgi:hypothetical protein
MVKTMPVLGIHHWFVVFWINSGTHGILLRPFLRIGVVLHAVLHQQLGAAGLIIVNVIVILIVKKHPTKMLV